MKEEKIGVVTHFYGKIGVAAVDLTDGDLGVGDTIHVKGHTSDFEQTIESIQLEHATVEKATKGQVIGIKLKEPVRKKDVVFKLVEE